VVAAAEEGVEVTPLSAYCLEPPARTGLRLGFTGYSPEEIDDGARRLAVALRRCGARPRDSPRDR